MKRSLRRRRLVIGTTTPEIQPGGIPTFIEYQKKTQEYSDSYFIEWCKEENGNQLSLGRFNRNKFLRAIVSQLRVLRRLQEFDELEVHSLRTGLVAILFASKKCTFFYHGPGFQEIAVESSNRTKVTVAYLIEAAAFALVKKFLTASDAFKKRLIENHGIRYSQIRVTRPKLTFELLTFAQSVNKKLNLAIENKVLNVVICRRMIRRVGVLEFLTMFKMSRRSDITIHVIGTGPLSSEVRELCANDPRLVFHGNLSDEERDAVYDRCLFNVLPSVHLEGLGMSIFEGIRANCIPLVTACEGMPELIEELGVGSYFRTFPQLIDAIAISFAEEQVKTMVAKLNHEAN